MNKRTIGLVLLGLVALALVASGIGKIVGGAEAAEAFGGESRPLILAVVEFLIVAALALPKTRKLGIILAASYFGGAIAFSWLAANEMPGASVALSVLLYVGAALVYPSLTDGSTAPTPGL